MERRAGGILVWLLLIKENAAINERAGTPTTAVADITTAATTTTSTTTTMTTTTMTTTATTTNPSTSTIKGTRFKENLLGRIRLYKQVPFRMGKRD